MAKTKKGNPDHKKTGGVIEYREKTGKYIAKVYGFNGRLVGSSRPLSSEENAEKALCALKRSLGDGYMVQYPDPAKNKTMGDLYAEREEKDQQHAGGH